jgi:outer membrane receptor protein involved in Fe transport
MPAAALAQDREARQFDLPAQDLGDALRTVAAEAGWELYASAEDVNGVTAPRLQGRLTARQAIERLLAGTDLRARFTKGAVIIRGRSVAAVADGDDGEEIVVTGTHIRNAPATGTLIRVTQEDIRNAGQTDLGEVVRSLPMNFSGGQNPGVGAGISLVNSNVNSASNINLRGLGPDATLTLLNGKRLPYDSAFQGVDISAIPAAAIDRIEILADGASALYGSDAIAGVANVILRQDFQGLETTGRIGASTEGGFFQQQANFVAGTHWEQGGLIVTYDYSHSSGIHAGSRDYAQSLRSDNSLYPGQRRHAATLSLHQDISDAMELRIDALYGKRTSTRTGGSGDVWQYLTPKVETFSISPEIGADLGDDWRFKVFGTYGVDRSHYGGTIVQGSAAAILSDGCYCNRAISAEVNADGALFDLPGGVAQIAFGAGFRRNMLHFTRRTDTVVNQEFDVAQTVYYGFSELSLPLLGPDQEIPGIHRLTLSAAARHERYPGIENITTPKIGLILEPARGLSIKGSWGRSFKAPTLYQQYVASEAYLFRAQNYGVGPVGTSVLYVSGGNPDLLPERSKNWSISTEFRPSAIPGLSLGAGYFDISYRDRVASPISGSVRSAFTNPAYASLLTENPPADLQSSLIAAAPFGLENLTGAAYSPASVVCLVDNRNRNVSRQRIKGVDFGGSYIHDLEGGRSLSLVLSGAYIESSQQVITTLPATSLAGAIFNPPHLRMRGGGTFSTPSFTLSGFINYTGSVRDDRFTPSYRVSGLTSIDLTGSLMIAGQRNEPNSLSVSLVANNLLNAEPENIRISSPSDTPYDSTNFSPIGRFIALSVSRKW